MEFSGELSDFIRTDVHRKFGHVKNLIRVTLIEVLFPQNLSCVTSTKFLDKER